jgi:uncharacterized protein
MKIFQKYLFIMSLFFTACFATPVREIHDYVNDFAHVLSSETQKALRQKLVALESSDSTQLVIVTIPSLEGQPIESVSYQIAQSTAIGSKIHNNGALLLVAVNDRQMRIEVGKGLEGHLTDVHTGSIVDSVIQPYYARNDFNGGTQAGIDAMINVVKGVYNRPIISLDVEARHIQRGIIMILYLGGLALWSIDMGRHQYQLRLSLAKRASQGLLGFSPGVRLGIILCLAALISFLLETESFITRPTLCFGILSAVLTGMSIWGRKTIDSFYEAIVSHQSHKSQDHSLLRYSSHSSPVALKTTSSAFKGGGGRFGGGGASGRF